MSFFKVILSSEEQLSLQEKKKYIKSMYMENPVYTNEHKRNQGFVKKFNNSIGFKPVVSTITATNTVISAEVSSPEGYLPPDDIILDKMHTPIFSNDIIHFYFEDKGYVHPDQRFSYKTKDIAEKWAEFLNKVFPHLKASLEVVEEIPKKSLKDFAMEYFYSSLSKEVNYTIEFSSSEKLTVEEIKEILSVVSELSNDKITIAQNNCQTCAEYSNGEKPFHIEIVYLTWYGRDEEEKNYGEYGDSIYKVS